METQIKQQFVKDVLEHQGARLLKNQGNAFYKKLQFVSGKLQQKRSVSVAGGGDMDGKLTFTHLARERFLDMPRTGLSRRGKTFRKQGYRIHNRFVYGTYFATARQLSVGLTEAIRGQIFLKLKTENNG